MNKFFKHSRYLFVFAHPDDEIYSCAFIQQLIQKDKEVHVLYVTSGNYRGEEQGPVREAEALSSMEVVGAEKEKIHFLRIPERQLMNKVKELTKILAKATEKISPDCIITHDFEGGHNGHDAVSFITSKTALKYDIALYVFPAYHDWPEKRLWNQFVPGRKETDTLLLTNEMKSLQNQVIKCHQTQESFFQLVTESGSAKLFRNREVLRAIEEPIDYFQPPTTPVGYEYPGSSITFEDFKKLINTESEMI